MTPINILIVDDKEENIVTLKALLKQDDICLITSSSANDALKKAWETPVHIALIDVQMPVMNGFELVKIFKSNPRTKDIMVIFVTASSAENKYVLKGLSAGAVDVLFKPLDPHITLAKVDAFIQIARYREQINHKNDELLNYEIFVKNSVDVICSIDAQSLKIKTINPAIEKIFGYRQAEIVGQQIVNIASVSDRDIFREKLRQIVSDELAFAVFEFQFSTFDKRIVWAECRATYRNNIIFLNISDFTPQKIYQQQLINDKNKAENDRKSKEVFLANMSHELRTPVSGIMGISKMLRQTGTTDHQNNLLDMMESSSRTLLSLINDVLDISKIEAGKYSITRKPAKVRDVINLVHGLAMHSAAEKNIALTAAVDENVPEILLFDALRLNQVLSNLVSNAVKFTDKGFVKIGLSVIKRDHNRVKLKFSVEDSGIGIPDNKLSKVFESFEQAEKDTASKYGGTGLGLTIVKKLVELAGGALTVNSELNKGTVFNFINWVEIAGPEVENTASEPGKLAPFNDVSVLLAEDNTISQFMMAKMLKDWNVAVEVVNDGHETISKLKNNDYDLILMDTQMPGMNGYQAAERIRTDFSEPKKSTPIISLSANAFERDNHQAISSGMNDVLSKPFEPHQLHEKMTTLLKRFKTNIAEAGSQN